MAGNYKLLWDRVVCVMAEDTQSIRERFESAIVDADDGYDGNANHVGSEDGVVLHKQLALRHIQSLAKEFEGVSDPWVVVAGEDYEMGGSSPVYAINTNKHDIPDATVGIGEVVK